MNDSSQRHKIEILVARLSEKEAEIQKRTLITGHLMQDSLDAVGYELIEKKPKDLDRQIHDYIKNYFVNKSDAIRLHEVFRCDEPRILFTSINGIIERLTYEECWGILRYICHEHNLNTLWFIKNYPQITQNDEIALQVYKIVPSRFMNIIISQ